MMKAAMTSGDRPDISQYAMNDASLNVPVTSKTDNEKSRDIDDVIETKQPTPI
jgi:hypothetical protein